jgi:transposase
MKEYGVSRRELFQELDGPAMRPLPEGRYRYASWKKAKVAPDYHVEFERHRYSVPSGMVGRQVELRVSQDTVEIFVGTKRLFTHARSFSQRGFTTEPAHMPSHHREFAEWTPERIEGWALSVGPNASEFVSRILHAKLHPEQAFRSCMGVISLARHYGKDRVEGACQRALTYHAYSYRNVKTILEKGLDAQPPLEAPPAPVSHANVRGSEYYQEVGPCAN